MVSHEANLQWVRKFGQEFASRMRRLPCTGRKRDLDEVVMKAAAVTHRLRRAMDEIGMALDVMVQSLRDKHARSAYCPSC